MNSRSRGDLRSAELWKVVEQNRYLVSNRGRVLGTRMTLLKPTPDKDGYRRVFLRIGGVTVTCHVARLVLEAFIGPAPSADHTAAHWDGDNTNDDLRNLRWATWEEQASDRSRVGTDLAGERHWNARLSNEDIRSIREVYRPRDAVFGATTLAERYGVTVDHMRHVLAGSKRK